MARGTRQIDSELAGLLYREKFGLSWHQLEDEPAEQIGLWLALEQVRAEEEKRLSKQHK